MKGNCLMRRRTIRVNRRIGEIAVTATCSLAVGLAASTGGTAETGAAVDMRPDVADSTDGASHSLRVTETVNEDGTGTTYGFLKLKGVEPGATLIAHGHVGSCPVAGPADELADTTGGHYMNDPGGPVDNENELWFELEESSKFGVYKAAPSVDWVARDGEMLSVVVHEKQDDGSNPKVLCLDL